MNNKFPPEFERDFKWFLSKRHIFTFDGSNSYTKNTVTVYDTVNNDALVATIPYKKFKELYPHLLTGSTVTQVKAGTRFGAKFVITSEEIIQYDRNGVSGKEAFYQWDSNGQVVATKHPNLLSTLLKVKGSVNFHIKLYAEDRAKGLLSKQAFEDEIISVLNPPSWFKDAVENQRTTYF